MILRDDRGRLVIQHQGWKLEVDRDWDGTVFVESRRFTLDVERFVLSEGFDSTKQYDVYLRSLTGVPHETRVGLDRLPGRDRLLDLFRLGKVNEDDMLRVGFSEGELSRARPAVVD